MGQTLPCLIKWKLRIPTCRHPFKCRQKKLWTDLKVACKDTTIDSFTVDALNGSCLCCNSKKRHRLSKVTWMVPETNMAWPSRRIGHVALQTTNATSSPFGLTCRSWFGGGADRQHFRNHQDAYDAFRYDRGLSIKPIEKVSWNQVPLKTSGLFSCGRASCGFSWGGPPSCLRSARLQGSYQLDTVFPAAYL